MTSNELRKKYLDFFQQKGHKVVPSSSLVPANDPTTLFITAGMQPLIPFLLGEEHPEGKRLVSVQRCLRTDDIDEVGDEVHHTFFEMLGNWSLGDYFKKDAINLSFEFLTSPEWLNIPKEKLAISVFAGDEDAHFDEESYNLWLELGVNEKRIAKLPKENNWWGPAGQTGPCGPDTEMFYWVGSEEPPGEFDPTNPNWVEIWNNVFMEYNKLGDGSFELLKQKNVDTGMGLERTLAVLNGLDDDYQTELFQPIIQKLEEQTGKTYKENKKEFRIIADHIKAATFLIKDGVLPSNKLQGYILRRLFRRAAVKISSLKENSMYVLSKLVDQVIDIYADTDYVFPEEKGKVLQVGNKISHTASAAGPYFQTGDWDQIRQVIEEEMNKFKRTYKEGLKEEEKIEDLLRNEQTAEALMEKNVKQFNLTNQQYIQKLGFKPISLASVAAGTVAFNLQSTYGFPAEEFQSILEEKNIIPNYQPHELADSLSTSFNLQQNMSRTTSVGMFKGGLADQTEQTTKLHTATHLLQAAAKQILGDFVGQRGSHITAERLRWDFNYPQKLTDEQLKQIEDLVNQKIYEDLKVWSDLEDKDQAINEGATTNHGENYPDKVKVYKIGARGDAQRGASESTAAKREHLFGAAGRQDPEHLQLFSKELCGGPHVEHTGVLSHFKILKERGVSSDIRRIYATVE